MSRSAIIVLVCLFAAGSVQAQSLMRTYRFIYSAAGYYGYSTNNSDVALGAGATAGSKVDREVLRFTTRDGYFVIPHLAVGGELFWDQTSTRSVPDPNPLNYRNCVEERRLFVGPWVRWYTPASLRWYAAAELSLGYWYARSSAEESSAAFVLPRTLTIERGFGGNAGIAVGHMVTRNIGLDLTARYSMGWLQGEQMVAGSPDYDTETDFAEFSLLFGIQMLF